MSTFIEKLSNYVSLTDSLIFFPLASRFFFFKDTHREKAPSNKTPALRKSTNMGVWAVGTLNQLFIRGSLTETKLSKK